MPNTPGTFVATIGTRGVQEENAAWSESSHTGETFAQRATGARTPHSLKAGAWSDLENAIIL